MNRPMYGFVRITEDMPDQDVDLIEIQLKEYAAFRGFDYAGTIDNFDGIDSGVVKIIETLSETGATDVVVPSLDHLSRHPVLQPYKIDQIKAHAKGVVHSLNSADALLIVMSRCDA